MPDRDRGRSRSRPDHQEHDRHRQDRQQQQTSSGAQARERGGELNRVRDHDRIQQIAARLQELERDHPDWAHTIREHVNVTDGQLATRAATGINARGYRDWLPPRHATRWQSNEAMVVAAYRLRGSDDFNSRQAYAELTGQKRFRTQQPLPEVLGPGWRSDVYGRSHESAGKALSRWHSDSQAVAIWQKQKDGRWHLYTCYPEVGS